MRFGNASTTVTGTVTPASVKTRVMPHLRPTRPMVIVESSFSESYDWLPLSLQSAGGLGTRDPRPLELHGSRKTGVGTHALRPLKLDREFYRFMRWAQAWHRSSRQIWPPAGSHRGHTRRESCGLCAALRSAAGGARAQCAPQVHRASVQLDLHIHARRKLELHEGIDG